MKIFQFSLLLFCSFLFANTFAQTSCPVVGWAAQNGGVTGGGSATPTVVSNYTDFKNAITSTTVKVVHISGTITFPSVGRINFQDQSGKTVYGLPGSKLVSVDRTASGSGILYVKRCTNIIFRNIKFEGPGAYDTDGNDNMTIDQCTNVWVDHCDFQDGVDGNLDVKNQTDYVSITWCRFIYLKPPIPGGSGGADDHRFSNLFGSSDGATADRGKLRITMQYCWWAQGCKERMPRVRFGKVHIVNNYFSSAGNNHCIRAGLEADLRVENNLFENVNLPIDLFENNFTAVSSVGNSFVNTTGNTAGSGTAFTPPYSLSTTSAANVKALVTSASCGAGATMSSPTACCGGSTTSYTLTTNSTPSAGGTITRNPSGTSYSAGTVVTLTATSAAGYTFTGWSGAVTSTATSVNVTMDANKTVTANFQQNQAGTYTLTTTASPAAGGTISRSPNAASYSSGTVVTLTAAAASGYTFTGWSGAVTSTASSVNVTMNANKSVTANFRLNGGTTSTIRIEDNATASTGLCSYDGVISSNSSAANGRVINLSNSAGNGISWSVNASAAGSYNLNWRYINSSSGNAFTMKLIVNGATVNSALSFPKTANSTTFSNTTASVNLTGGTNTIRIETTVSSASADIDWLEITGISPVAGNCAGASSALQISSISDVEKLEADDIDASHIDVYPNPAKGSLNISVYSAVNEKVNIILNSADGKVVRESGKISSVKGNIRYTMNVTNIKAGSYYLVLIHEKGMKETKRVTIL